MAEKQNLSRKKKILFLLTLYAFLSAVGLALLITATIIHRTKTFYDFHKGGGVVLEGRIFHFDPELGLAITPDSQGDYLYPDGYKCPVRFDHNGFRIPFGPAAPEPPNQPALLTLGCSYSFGFGCPAEKAYPYLLGQRLNLTSENAARPLYGLAQMTLLAHRLIPSFKPELVLAQYSPWLIDRHKDPIHFYNWVMTTPYFMDAGSGRLAIHPPVFTPKIFELDLQKYHYTKKGFADYLAFLAGIGFPLYLGDGWSLAAYEGKRLLGSVPRSVTDSAKIVEFAYGEIARLCRENHARLVIVIITDPGNSRKPTAEELAQLRAIPDALIVNTEAALLKALPAPTKEAYDSAYRIWNGSPPVLIDMHPNEAAHEIMAAEIIRILQSSAGGQ